MAGAVSIDKAAGIRVICLEITQPSASGAGNGGKAMGKLIRRSVATLLAAGLLTAIFGVSAAAAGTVEVTTEAATEITPTGATLNATVVTSGEKVTAGFEYGLKEYENANWTSAAEVATKPSVPVHISLKISGLSPKTTYYFAAAAYGGGAFGEGKYMTFKTPKRMGLWITTGETPTFNALEYPAEVAGDENVGGGPLFHFGSQNLECGTTHFTAGLATAVQTLPLNASLSSCTLGSLGAATVKVNSCYFSFTLKSLPYTGSGAIACETPGDAIEIVAPGCTVKVAVQSLGIVSFSSGEPGGEGSKVSVSNHHTVSYAKTGLSCFVLGTGEVRPEMSLAQVG
jgi:hypothetical protein